ncbi:MAG: hypothetical protein A3C58_02660 [Candidatus Staskawiczbacteria bacterium RIFCSPHIGHO2_02_FULL_34_10]|uniref:Uncharacterized protein n=1 Tax=Candidatus Staskawiczbacteria bacterium RIFCSPHIGHO2_02_FULL_34_10 TaxID=1802205 RepID=A0A1G2HWH2_9BACT|nr:MAG: hypothetical protein A3C58_02660 [Candidatus Staskawiczbacteria bacterium RIFCSPHIGHO2_02_FULL_34_10]
MDKEIKEQINGAMGWGIIVGFLFGGIIGMGIGTISFLDLFNFSGDSRSLLAFFTFLIVMAVVFILVHWKIINKE